MYLFCHFNGVLKRKWGICSLCQLELEALLSDLFQNFYFGVWFLQATSILPSDTMVRSAQILHLPQVAIASKFTGYRENNWEDTKQRISTLWGIFSPWVLEWFCICLVCPRSTIKTADDYQEKLPLPMFFLTLPFYHVIHSQKVTECPLCARHHIGVGHWDFSKCFPERS